MRQSGHWARAEALDADQFQVLIRAAIKRLNLDQARAEVLPFVPDPAALDSWSPEFFFAVVKRIRFSA